MKFHERMKEVSALLDPYCDGEVVSVSVYENNAFIHLSLDAFNRTMAGREATVTEYVHSTDYQCIVDGVYYKTSYRKPRDNPVATNKVIVGQTKTQAA